MNVDVFHHVVVDATCVICDVDDVSFQCVAFVAYGLHVVVDET